MSKPPAADRCSPKPLRFVPYNPSKTRKPRKANGQGLAATSSNSAPPVAPASLLSTIQNAAESTDVPSNQDPNDFATTSEPDTVRVGENAIDQFDFAHLGEWYQAMGFGFLPLSHQGSAAGHVVAGGPVQAIRGRQTPVAVPSSSGQPILPHDTERKDANATVPRLPEVSNIDQESQWPLALDHLHSWQDLLKDSSERQAQISAATESIRHPPTFSIPVFRWFGNTSIAPGTVKTQARIKQLDRKIATNEPSSPASESQGGVAEAPRKIALFDSQDSTYPSETALDHLLGVFITHFICHFPFLDSAELRKSNRDRKLSKGLVNSICALASRFSELPSFLDSNGNPDFAICDAYSDAAKQALLPLLAIPTLEVLQSYILLTWSEWGNGRDAGFWMYSGICVRMAQDLGLAVGSRTEFNGDPALASQAQLTFWAVFFLDRVVSYGTGRRVTIFEEDIQIPLPHSSVNGVPYVESPRNPWFVMIRILRYRGMVGDIINAKQLTGTESASLAFLQREMADYYKSLPSSLQFTPKNFQLYKEHNQTSTFTLIHLLFHATIILLHRPSLLQAADADINFALIGTLHERSKEISRSSARSIADIIHYVELLGPTRAIYCNLFVDHAIFLTAMSFLADLADEPHDTDSMLSVLAETQFQRCRSALRKLASYWHGADFVCGVIDQRSAGLSKSVQHSLEGHAPRPIVVEYALDRLPGGFLPSISVTQPGSPTLSEGRRPESPRSDGHSYQGLSFVGSLDPEPQDGQQIALVGQAWLGSSLLSLQSGAGAEGQGLRHDSFMLFQDPYG